MNNLGKTNLVFWSTDFFFEIYWVGLLEKKLQTGLTIFKNKYEKKNCESQKLTSKLFSRELKLYFLCIYWSVKEAVEFWTFPKNILKLKLQTFLISMLMFFL